MPTKDTSLKKEKNFLIKFCDTIITASIFLVIFLVPLFFTGLVSQGIIFEKMILFYLLILIGLVAWITKGVVQGRLNIIRTPLDLPILGLGVILLISSLFSVNKGASFFGTFGYTTKSFLAFIAYITFFYLVVNNINPRRIKIFLMALTANIFITVIYAILQISGIFILPFAATKIASFNPIGSSSSLGIYIASILPILAVIIPAFTSKDSLKTKKIILSVFRIIIILLALTALFTLFLLNNFIYWPVVILGMVILLMFALAKVIKFSSADMIIPILSFVFLIIFLVGGNFNLINTKLPAEVSLSKNLSWNIAKESLKHDTLFGSGLATFNYSFAKYRGTEFNESSLWTVRFDTASGSFFEILASVGVLGFLGFLIIALIFISVSFIALTKSVNNNIKIILLGLFASLIILILNMATQATSGSIILLIVIFGSFAMALIISDYPEKFKEVILSFQASPKYALALAAIFLFVSAGVVVLVTTGFKVYLADYYVNKVNIRENIDEAIQDVNRAINTFDKNDKYYLTLSRLYVQRANQEANKGSNADIQLVQSSISSAINIGKSAIELSPNSVVNNESLATIYESAANFGISGSLEWAEKYYNEVIELEPDNPNTYIRLALIKVAQANGEQEKEEKKYFYEEAVKYYEQAISKKSNLPTGYYGIAIVQEQLGDFDQAVKNLGQAVSLAGDNLDYRFELGRMYFNKGAGNLKQEQTSEITSNEEDREVIEEGELSVDVKQSAKKMVKSEDLALAEAIFKSVVEISPKHANAIYSLGLIYETIGEKEQAREQYRKLLDIVPEQATKDIILQKLGGL